MTELLRVTPATMQAEIVNNLDNNTIQQAVYQEQLSTGYQVNQPSDNPGQIASILQQKALVQRTEQYIANANDGVSYLGVADNAVNEVLGMGDQLKALVASVSTISAAGGGATALQGVINEIQGLQQAIMNQANATYNGVAVFGGTVAGNQAFNPGTGLYIGTFTALKRTVAPGVQLQASVVGANVFGTGATATSLFGAAGVLQTTIADINNVIAGVPGSVNQVQTVDQSNLDTAISTIATQAATIGALFQSVQNAGSAANNTKTVLNNELSTNIDTNVAQATTNLQLQETTYQSALWAAAQVNKMTLLDFVS